LGDYMILFTSRGSEEFVIKCYELVRARKGDSTDSRKLDISEILKGFIEVCPKAELHLLTSISSKGYRSSLIVASNKENLQKCSDILKALLKTGLPEWINVKETECLGIEHPFSLK